MTAAAVAVAIIFAGAAIIGWTRWLELREECQGLADELDREVARADEAAIRAATALQSASETRQCLEFVLRHPLVPAATTVAEPVAPEPTPEPAPEIKPAAKKRAPAKKTAAKPAAKRTAKKTAARA